jgi:hypothetical protein
MDISTISQLIGSLGFPIFISVYLLVTTNKILEANTKMLSDLKDEIARMNNLK